ncbi:hypothetical protein [Mesorhizobium sp. IMUNJ 23232]|uniref:hypothetical protein n=1 Tax=Mesorhizobium sp. IMUNJ 23232 TaxID=3376064 RepID=UPI0037A71277
MTLQNGDEKCAAAKKFFPVVVFDLANPLKSLEGDSSVRTPSEKFTPISSPPPKPA